MEEELLEAKPGDASALGKFHKLMEECTDETVEADFSFDSAVHQHVQFAMRQSHKSRWVQPWERGIMVKRDIFPNTFQTGAISIASQPAESSKDDDSGTVPRVASSKRLKVSAAPTMSWENKLSNNRLLAIQKWVVILKCSPLDFGVIRLLWTARQAGLDNSTENVFSGKATGTIHARAGPILRYIGYWKSRKMSAIPFTEAMVNNFLQDVGEKFAATFSRSFICSLAYAVHVLQCESAKECVQSKRVTGLAAKHYLRKRALLQKEPLKVEHVRALEFIVMNSKYKLYDRVAAGFFCYLIYARARFSDGQHSGNMKLDLATEEGSTSGYIEAGVTRSKSSYTLERKTRHLPMVAPVQGLHEECWGLHWFKCIKLSKLELGDKKPLLPAPNPSGGWQQLPITAEAGGVWLRSLLTTAGASKEQVAHYGAHSCKATTLSWLAKAGVDLPTRALLGYHSVGKSSTALIYGRDNMAAPLRVLEEWVNKVALGTFKPDQTRSGMLAKGSEGSGKTSDGDDAGDAFLSSSEDSADEEAPDHQIEESAVEEVVGDWLGHVRPEHVNENLLFRHPVSRTIHVLLEESSSKFKCGREVSSTHVKIDSKPKVFHPVCKQCFPGT